MTPFEKFIDALEDAAACSANESASDQGLIHMETIDQAIDVLQKIYQWTDAYPPDIFIPMTSEDWKEHHEILKGANRSGSAAAADSMRHVVQGIQKLLDEARK